MYIRETQNFKKFQSVQNSYERCKMTINKLFTNVKLTVKMLLPPKLLYKFKAIL